MALNVLLQSSEGELECCSDKEVFEQFESRFIEAEMDAFGVKIWTDKVKKPFPVTTMPYSRFSHVADRFPEGTYYIVVKLNNDPNGELNLLKATRKGLKNTFLSEFEELYISDQNLSWLLFARLNDSDLVELVGSGDVCPIR